MEIAPDLTVPTLDGDWKLSEHWTGCRAYAFVVHRSGSTVSDQVWSSDPSGLLRRSPDDLDLFFLSNLRDDPQGDVQALRDRFDTALAGLDQAEAEAWGDRLHFVTARAKETGGWLGQAIADRKLDALGIDAFQRVRQVGYLADITGSGQGEMELVAWQGRAWSFERRRQAALDAEDGVTVVPVFSGETVSGSADADVALPDDLAGFDTMEIDLSLSCPDHLDSNCGAWDYMVKLYLCDQDDPESCTTELGRWVTAYGREGRWVFDASPALALLGAGGTRRMRLESSQSYQVDLSLRLRDRGLGGRPRDAVWLFAGGPFDEHYNDAYEPISFEVPADARRVELYAVISGHGWGRDTENCAEFCNHTHHFTVNGVEFVKEHPEAGTRAGCRRQVDDGVVPDQYGTWPYGRGGWCPGYAVAPWIVDITDVVDIGGANTIEYRALLGDEEYVPVPVEGDPNGFDAVIDMVSWLVISR